MKEEERLELLDKLREQREAVGKFSDLPPEKMDEYTEALSAIIYADYECRHDAGIQRTANYCTCLDCGNLVNADTVGRVFKTKHENVEKIRNLYLRCLLCTDTDTAIKTLTDVYELKLMKPGKKS